MGMGKVLILLGLILLVVGVLWLLGERLGLGRLPGDIIVRNDRFTLYVPLMTSIVVSVLLSVFLWLVHRWSP